MKISKRFLSDFKQSKSIVIRFDERSSIDLFFANQFNKEKSSTTYQYDHKSKEIGTWHCFLYENTQQSTIINLIQVNDQIEFYQEDHGYDVLAENNFIHDQLMIRITRYKKNDPLIVAKTMTFCFDSQVTRYTPNFTKRQFNHLKSIK